MVFEIDNRHVVSPNPVDANGPLVGAQLSSNVWKTLLIGGEVMEEKMIYFEKPGNENTVHVIKLVKERVR